MLLIILSLVQKRRQKHLIISSAQFLQERENQTDIPDLGSSKVPNINDLTITTEGVEKLLSDLNPHKASSPDGITARVLKSCSTNIAPILQRIFQISVSTGLRAGQVLCTALVLNFHLFCCKLFLKTRKCRLCKGFYYDFIPQKASASGGFAA